MKKVNATNNAKIQINGTDWYVPHYTLSTEQQKIISKQIIGWISTELWYVERSIFMEKVSTRNTWTSQLGTEERTNVPMRNFVCFQQRDREDSQKWNIDGFYRPPVTSSQGNNGKENYPYAGILKIADDDDYNHW